MWKSKLNQDSQHTGKNWPSKKKPKKPKTKNKKTEKICKLKKGRNLKRDKKRT